MAMVNTSVTVKLRLLPMEYPSTKTDAAKRASRVKTGERQLKSIFFHPAIERSPRQSQFFGCFGNISAVQLNGLHYRRFFDFVKIQGIQRCTFVPSSIE